MMLSIVIPAFNEEKRLPRTLDKIIAYLSKYYTNPFEIIIVNDGSGDKTLEVVGGYIQKYPFISLVDEKVNKGRGYAVRVGVAAAKGDIVLETDADGSVEEEAITRFVSFFEANPGVDVLIGSRRMAGAEILTPQPLLRVLLGKCFLFLAHTLFAGSIHDYTLGFKMFRRAAAQKIFSQQVDNRYIAEAEIIVLASKNGFSIKELPVLWTDFSDSRVNPLRDSIRSFKGLIDIYLRLR